MNSKSSYGYMYLFSSDRPANYIPDYHIREILRELKENGSYNFSVSAETSEGTRDVYFDLSYSEDVVSTGSTTLEHTFGNDQILVISTITMLDVVKPLVALYAKMLSGSLVTIDEFFNQFGAKAPQGIES